MFSPSGEWGMAGMNEWDWELGSLVVLSGQGLSEKAHMGGEGRGSKQQGLSPTEARPPFLSYISGLYYYCIGTKELGALQ